MNRSLLFLFLLLPLIAPAQFQKMSEAESASFQKSVNATSEKIKTIASDFIQLKHLDFLDKEIETSGKMVFSEPSNLAWQYEKPYKYSIVFKNNKVYINDAGKKSSMDANASKIFGKLNSLIVGSLSGKLFNDREFEIAFLKSRDRNLARLKPRDAELRKYLREIELYFDPVEHQVTEVRLVESAADYTRIIFKNKRINVAVPGAAFAH